MTRQRPLIAFFDYADVFEDFYRHYGVSQRAFATTWASTGNHAFLKLLQREVGDVIWYAFSLAPEFAEAHHEVVGCRVKLVPSSWLHRLLWKMFYLPRFAWRWRVLYRVYATFASYIALLSLRFLRTLWRDRPDLFFVQSYSSGRFDVLLLLARGLGVPLIAYHAGGRPEGYLGRQAKKWTIPRADWLLVSGQDEYDMLVACHRVQPDRLRIILTPIDTEVYRPWERTEACRVSGLDPTRRYLLYVGRFDDDVKRVSSIMRCFAWIAPAFLDTDLLLVGEGPDGQRLRALASNLLPERIRFLGWISGAEAQTPLYSAAECLLLASSREGFPTVAGEAMACGTPVLASRVGGISELVIENRTGWLVPPGDDEAFTQRLVFVLSHREAVAAMRSAVRTMAEKRVSPAVVASALRACLTKGLEHA